MWQERNARGIEGSCPCDTCRVELDAGNEEAAQVFQLVRWQTVTTEYGEWRTVDLSLSAVKIAMDLHAVQDQKACLLRVRNLWYHVQAEERRRNENR